MKIRFNLIEPYQGGVTLLAFGERYDFGVWFSYRFLFTRRFRFRRSGYLACGPFSVRWGSVY